MILGIKPYSREWRALTRRRVVECARNILMDEGAQNDAQEIRGGNPNFDEKRFEALKEGRG